MEGWFGFLKEILTDQPLLQVFTGGVSLLLVGYMVTRGVKDREKLPPPALGAITDMPAPSFQGPAAMIDLQREMRDYLRRMSEDISRVAECVRVTKEENVKQTGLLDKIEREQAVENRAHERESRGGDR